jgi:pSer/pThr/pTyr-binding forkhead associated (FHA) protein
LKSRILLGLIAGGAGGLLGGVISETLIPYNSYIQKVDGVCAVVQPTSSWPTLVLAFSVYGLIALLLGGVDGVVEGNPRKLVRGMLIGLFGGVILGKLGSDIGHIFYVLLGGSDVASTNPSLFAFVRQIVARSVLFAFLGTGLGVGAALATMNPKRIFQGGLGGLIGGTIGGMLFDLIGSSVHPIYSAVGTVGCYDAGGPGRMLSYILIGALTGFFIGLMQELFKQAWVKVLAGRNEGKDFILSKPMNLMGRDERCDVPLYGDASVGVQHAAIRADGKRHLLLDAGTPTGTLVNGQRAETGKELLLRDGDMIQIGQHRILFREKATQSKFAHKPIDEPKSKPNAASVPMPSHLCPFCGAPKDITGKCLCSLGNGGPAGAPGGGGMAMGGMNPNPGFGAPADLGGYGGAPMPGPAGGGGGAPGYGAPAPGYGAPGYNGGAAPGYGAPASGFGDPMNGIAALGQLVGAEGPYSGQVFALVAANSTVGRETTCDIVLSADTTISRTHARLINEGGNFVVYDNGSSNGTFVNGMRLSSPVALAPGDSVQFGGSKFRFE